MSDQRRKSIEAEIAYHIDKTCTGGTEEDWVAAARIYESVVEPFASRLAELEAENGWLRGSLKWLVTFTDPYAEEFEGVHLSSVVECVNREARAALNPSPPETERQR